MKRLAVIGILSVVVLLAVALPAGAAPASTYTSSVVLPFPLGEWIPCANDGLGEHVNFSGKAHNLYHFTTNGNSFTIRMLGNYQGLGGVGQVTGDKYRATSVEQLVRTGSFANGQYSFTYSYSLRFIGQGDGNNYVMHFVHHYTLNSNGDVTVEFVNQTVDCR
jgi:hypothetical protein